MRKAQREIPDTSSVLKVLDKCQTIRLALHDDTFPYIVPLSFGWEKVGDDIYVYFHCAKEGKKIDLIDKNNAVCFEADMLNGYVTVGQSVTADYKSVIGYGYAERISGADAVRGIDLLMKHCGFDDFSAENCVLTGIVAVYRIRVTSLTGKERFK